MTNSEFNDLLKYIQERSENELRNIITNFFCEKDILTYLTHGIFEKGADVVLCIEKDKDILGRGLIIFFQVKKGNIGTDVWRHSLHSQLYELYDRKIFNQPYNSPDTPRRIVLITTGTIEEPVKEKISRMNEKHHIPIESFDGPQFVNFLYGKGYRENDAENDISSRQF